MRNLTIAAALILISSIAQASQVLGAADKTVLRTEVTTHGTT